MYGVETRTLKQAVRRNKDRFPEDFMFQLSKFVISYPKILKFSPATPFVCTEQGVSMLSSVLNSKKAIQVNISIIRAFVVLRQHLADYKDLKEAIATLEKEMNTKFKDINQALHYLLNKDHQQTQHDHRKHIGFKNNKE